MSRSISGLIAAAYTNAPNTHQRRAERRELWFCDPRYAISVDAEQ